MGSKGSTGTGGFLTGSGTARGIMMVVADRMRFSTGVSGISTGAMLAMDFGRFSREGGEGFAFGASVGWG